MRSRVYVVCMTLLTLYLGVAGVMFYGNGPKHRSLVNRLTSSLRQHIRNQRGYMLYWSQVCRIRPSLGLRSVNTLS